MLKGFAGEETTGKRLIDNKISFYVILLKIQRKNIDITFIVFVGLLDTTPLLPFGHRSRFG